ncbi:MAG TPA: ligase [Streptosporangiaceae bacterium]|jgi:hypothetical protein
MTAQLPASRARRRGPVPEPLPETGPGKSPRVVRRRPAWIAAWPITALLVLYPLWWALGLADYMPVLLALPMAARMYAWRHSGARRILFPPGFPLWLLFLLCTAVSALALPLTAPETIDSSVSNRALSFGQRGIMYLGITVLLIYAGNLTEKELPRRRLAWMLGLIGVYAIVGGIAAMLAPHFQFSSPLLTILPHSLRSNYAIASTMHPGLAQAQYIVGAASGRPKAPFDFTNTWGNCLSLVLPWLVAVWCTQASRRQRFLAIGLLVVSVGPIIYSLNRAMWIGLGISAGYVGLRMVARGRLAPLAAMMAGIAVIGIALVATPLSTVITQRLDNGQSNQIRSNLTSKAIEDALASPVIGYGDTRRVIGSVASIAIGPTANCPACGQAVVGSNGQLWLLLVCVGFPGTLGYLGFFAYGAWRYRRDRTPIGLAGVLVLLLPFLYMTTYVAVGPPLEFTMLAYAVLWKNDRAIWPGSALRGRLDPAPVDEMTS